MKILLFTSMFTFLFSTLILSQKQVVPINNSSGTLSVTGSDYKDNMHVQYNIDAGPSGNVRIVGHCMLQSIGTDWLSVYETDETFTNLTLVAEYVYANIDYISKNNNGKLVVVFQSDHELNTDMFFGFTLDYNVSNVNILETERPVLISQDIEEPNLKIVNQSSKRFATNTNNIVNFDQSTLLVQDGNFKIGFSGRTIGASNNLYLKSEKQMDFNSNGYYSFNAPGKTLMSLNQTGTLDLEGSLVLGGNIRANLNKWIGVYNGKPWDVGSTRLVMHATNDNAYIDFKDNLSFRADNPGVSPLTLQGDGNVAIGYSTSYATDGTQYRTEGNKLAVNGATLIKGNLTTEGLVKAEEILVEAKGNTADFVFEEDYKLKSLSEVEDYIKTNKHLPEIPSAKEMEKQGVNLAQMCKLLLQKVEELTLYTIELEKVRNDDKIEKNKLEERLLKIENALKINIIKE